MRVSYTYDTFQQEVETGDIYVIPRVVARAMIEDERLSPEWDNEKERMEVGGW